MVFSPSSGRDHRDLHEADKAGRSAGRTRCNVSVEKTARKAIEKSLSFGALVSTERLR
jgi:hypothetical protein